MEEAISGDRPDRRDGCRNWLLAANAACLKKVMVGLAGCFRRIDRGRAEGSD